jgi:two-component system, LytTR family, response regulator LytT
MSTGKLKVLVVEDELPARERLISMLRKFDEFGEIQEASNGEEGLAKMPEYRPDVVFLDIQMPGIGGIGLARELMAEDEPPLIIFVTAYDKYAIEAFEVNAIDYLTKPADRERLETTVERIREILETKETKGQFIDDLSMALDRLMAK